MHRVGLLVLPGFQNMCFAALSAFEVANRKTAQPAYGLHVVSERGGPVPCSMGMEVTTVAMDALDLDTILIAVGMEVPAAPEPVLDHLRRAVRSGRRVASICLGAFVLGQAGLLEGRRVTTHWRWAEELKARHPAARVEMDRLFIQDQDLWSSAGMASGIDLALQLIESDQGRDVARATAKGMVIHHRRAGGQSQHSALLDLDAQADRIQSALAYARRNLHEALSVENLAEVACLSTRQFSRLFRQETGTSPAKAVETLRLEAARVMLEENGLSIDSVSRRTGFGDPERMRRAFLRAYGRPPSAFHGRRSEQEPAD
ncbi:GlxA family transcriptional regulator [Azospirillum sp. SYSU D00513]|uniref:GlxA family transcriptional regulator n=1 Tax=Azospirillum sp. SYSU D00513 TaxID=2812561 RepID=UPI001A96B967|nr:GlxA family transcriptional regulator [Azospirillum sp. SYSU D00513]